KLKYASPEQAGFLKEGEHLDPRSDLYSFGIVMYEMLAGRAPFQATNPHGYILKHVTEKPAAIGELNPEVKVPPQLEAIIMQSLEKNREHRFETAADFATALENIRGSIAPDQKYGVGEKMITLSGAQTLADLPKVNTGQFSGGTFPQGGTLPAQRVGPTGTKAAAEEATMMTRETIVPPPSSSRTISSDEATVMENFGRTQAGGASASGAAPTLQEKKWQAPAEAEATVIERQMQMPPPKTNYGRLAGIASMVVFVLAIGGYYFTHRTPAPAVPPTTTQASGTSVTTTAPDSTAPVPAGQGVLLLSASPWGDLDKIINADTKKPVELSDDQRTTPTRIELQPGKYVVTLNGPNERSTTFDVQIEAGKRVAIHKDTANVDYGQLEKEIQP
ncbi:MAG TPA: protein kinase, partial [Thermoanaerobaculia bacterium]|nr:protein kinase [Thermoanaerobaculia bacterium]